MANDSFERDTPDDSVGCQFRSDSRSEGRVTPAIGIYRAKQYRQILYGGADLRPAPFFLLSTLQTLECGEDFQGLPVMDCRSVLLKPS